MIDKIYNQTYFYRHIQGWRQLRDQAQQPTFVADNLNMNDMVEQLDLRHNENCNIEQRH